MQAGHDATLTGPGDAAPAGADVLVVDLGATFDGVAVVESLTAAGELGTRLLGVYRRVDVETRNRAREAGFDLVVPRSRMAREAGALIDRLVKS